MAEFDRYTNDYDAMLEESLAPLGGFNDYYLHRKVSLVEIAVKKAGIRSVLDFGCGLGGTTLMLKKAFPDARVVGVDVSRESIEQASLRHSGIEFGCIADDVFIAPYLGTFDLIYIANVFHHVPLSERTIVMNTLRNMLAPNGKIFFFEHNPYNPMTKWIVSRCKFDRDALLLTAKESRYLLEKAGFKVDRTIYLLFFPHVLRALAKIELFITWLPLGAQYCVTASL
jgi:SAM-dependent methyltransferase